MTINQNTTFLAFDFETTGLDTRKDEPIQIGIVRADSQFRILDTYTSLIKPKKDIKELKNIVKFITWLSLDQLSDAPSMEEILPDIRHRFTNDVVVLGHNISFDIAMMQPFLPDRKPQHQFDTFTRSQTLIHYPPSYALEVLWWQITDKYAKHPFTLPSGKKWNHTNESHHDALYDSFTSLALARHLIQRIETLTDTYDRLPSIIQQHALLSYIFHPWMNQRSNNIVDSASGPEWQPHTISLPILTKPIPKNATDIVPTDPVVDFRQIPKNKTRFSGHISLERMILAAVASKPIIIATHTGQKLEIIKHILMSHGHHHIGYAKPEQHIDYEAFVWLLHQENLSDDIITFTLKYLSHHHQGLRVLQLLTEDERAIFDAIENHTERQTHDIVLCSHGGLYRMIEQDLYPDHTILYLDADWRYHSYNRFRSISFDPYQALTSLERIQRSYQIRQQITFDPQNEKILDQLHTTINEATLFVGTIGIETTTLFTGQKSSTIETGPMIDHIDRRRTTQARPTLRDHLDTLLTIDTIQHKHIIQQLRDHLILIMTEMVTIQRNIRDRGYLHYIYKTTHEYSDFSEFMDIFSNRHAIITSHVRTTNKPLIPMKGHTHTPPTYPFAPTPPQLIQKIYTLDPQQSMTHFVLSSSKSSSQSLFQKIQSDPQFSSYSLIVDGITGSTAKNTHKAQQPGPTIIIGWYYFYLNLLAKKVPVDHIIIYALGGAMKPLILGDVGYYS